MPVPTLSVRGGGDRLAPPVARLVRALSLAVMLQWAGAGALLPLLPLYVHRRGGSDAVVGAVMAAYFAGAFVFQYVAGRLSDRVGRLGVLLGGLVVYATGGFLFLLPVPITVDVAFRAMQGAGAGASEVAALAMLAQAVPLSHRGRAVARVLTGQLGGFAVGPVLGSVAGVGAMHALFIASALAALAAAGPIMFARARSSARFATEDPEVIAPPPHVPVRRALTGALLAAALFGVTGGVYEACWTLLMTHRGAAPWEVGLSWSLFCVPFAVMSRPGGWLADHLDRRWLACGAILWTVAFCGLYPFLPLTALIVLGAAEAVGYAVALPACQSLLGQGASLELQGRAQGLFAASETGATAVAATCAGVLYGVAPWVPFEIACGLVGGLTVLLAVIWRPVPGRVPCLVGDPGG